MLATAGLVRVRFRVSSGVLGRATGPAVPTASSAQWLGPGRGRADLRGQHRAGRALKLGAPVVCGPLRCTTSAPGSGRSHRLVLTCASSTTPAGPWAAWS